MFIIWSNHAKQRAKTRGVDVNAVPEAQILGTAERMKKGEQFLVESGKVIYVCCRTKEAALIVTVYRKFKDDADKGLKPPPKPQAPRYRRCRLELEEYE